MFDIGWSELLVVALVALIAIGPKELPTVLRALGHWMGKVRRMANDFQDQFREAMREAEMDDLKKQVDELSSAAGDITSYNPLEDLSKDVEDLNKDVESAFEDKPVEEAGVKETAEKHDEIATTAAAAADERPDPVESPAATSEPAPAAADEQKLASAEAGKTDAPGGRPA
jgi:sec-independent protein translocase protein TatB